MLQIVRLWGGDLVHAQMQWPTSVARDEDILKSFSSEFLPAVWSFRLLGFVYIGCFLKVCLAFLLKLGLFSALPLEAMGVSFVVSKFEGTEKNRGTTVQTTHHCQCKALGWKGDAKEQKTWLTMEAQHPVQNSEGNLQCF